MGLCLKKPQTSDASLKKVKLSPGRIGREPPSASNRHAPLANSYP